ncbi:integrase arm-type DNA-binding domain-containing protein, partial [Arcobacteraceae bacterium]|nr:integrase arm-type DNA-binding domain-containing protein [Arcobacteraceae bacterium]
MAQIDLLQDIQIRQSKPKEKKYYLNDGGGLRLCINTNGNKVWVFRYMMNKKSKETTFKSYPATTLKNARDKRTQYKDLISQDIDPIEYFNKTKDAKLKEEKGLFKDVMYEWLDKESLRTIEVTHKNKIRVFEKDVLPYLKLKHIKDVDIDDIIKILETKQLSAPEIASRLFNYLDNLFRYAVLKRYCDRNLLADIRKSDIIIPRTAKHMAKITDLEVLKELVNSIYTYNGGHSMRNAMKLLLHIPLRADNLTQMKWEYIDLDKKLLTIPRAKMKIKNINIDDFKIPLTDEVIEILQEQYNYSSNHEYVFLGIDNCKPINRESPNRVLERMGFNDESKGRKIRLHGFRGTFRSLIDELDTTNKFSFEVKERALDHHDKNMVVRAYNHKANFVEQLKPLMKWWSDFI